MKFQVITDSTSDLDFNDRNQYKIDYLKMVFTIDEKQYDADLDWSIIDPDTYYRLMRSGKRSITSLIKQEETYQKFEQYLKEGKDVLYVTCSSKLSGSINSATIIAKELEEKYPNQKVICFDSLKSNYAEGYMAIEAAKLANKGFGIDKAITKLNEIQHHLQTWATVGSLTYMKNAGRVKASTAFFGNLFHVKPIVVTDRSGQNAAFKKVKGRKESLDELVNIINLRQSDNNDYPIIIEHANCLEDAKYVLKKIKTELGLKAFIKTLGPIIGATCGPDTITINFYGKEIDFVL